MSRGGRLNGFPVRVGGGLGRTQVAGARVGMPLEPETRGRAEKPHHGEARL